MKDDDLKVEDLEVGIELKEKQKWLNKREQFYRNRGFYKVKGEYEFYKDVKHTITEVGKDGAEIFCGKKTNKGINAKQWFDLKRLNERFEK